MNLEEMLRQEREGIAPNPLMQRTDEIVTRVRRRRRGRAAAAGVVSLVALAVIGGLAGQLLPADTESAPAETTPSDAVPLPEEDSPVDPGRYVASVASEVATVSAPSLLPVLSVPEGYEGVEGGIGVRTDDLRRYLWVWDIDSVWTHPCEIGAGLETVGPSVADLANALAARPLHAGTDPVPVTVGGYDGLYLELSVPTDVDVTACPGGQFRLWSGRWQQEPGQVDMLWILDVEGQRITFDASHFPDASPDKVAELKDMVTTATFTPADGS